MEKKYILYDGIAHAGMGTDNANILCVCSSNKQAKSYKGGFGSMACYSYDVDSKNENELINEQWEWDYYA
jgi:hypothetical protein